MHINKCRSFIFLPFIFWPSPTIGQRRIVDGRTTNVNATFMVYLLRHDPEAVGYRGWTCGGCIVDRWFVLTSAACVEDELFVYVVAGYEKYVMGEKMDTDDCIKNTRKRIVSWCRRKEFSIGDYSQSGEWFKSRLWATNDIALARVHEPFDFQDPVYLQYCTYQPTMLPVAIGNLTGLYGGTALAYGWGHKKFMRGHNDFHDYNSERLYYVALRLMDKAECQAIYPFDFIRRNIKWHGICASGHGFLDDEGRLTNLMDLPSNDCNNDTCRRDFQPTRRQGICQNDHGGPLIKWIGTKKFVIGVASFFRVSQERLCSPPYVFMSTTCVNKFLACILSRTRRFDSCAKQHNMEVIVKPTEWSEGHLKNSSNETVTKRPSSTEELLDLE